MGGQVLDFTIQTNSGVIAGQDGNRYSFTGADWHISGPPRVGMPVDFDANGNRARGIYAAAAPTPTPARAVAQQTVVPSPARANIPRTAPAGAGGPIPVPAANPEQARRAGTLGIIGLIIGVVSLFLFWIPVLGWALMIAGLGMSMAGWVMAKQHGGQMMIPVIGTVVNTIPVAIHTIVFVLLVLLWKIVTETISTFLPFLKWLPFL